MLPSSFCDIKFNSKDCIRIDQFKLFPWPWVNLNCQFQWKDSQLWFKDMYSVSFKNVPRSLHAGKTGMITYHLSLCGKHVLNWFNLKPFQGKNTNINTVNIVKWQKKLKQMCSLAQPDSSQTIHLYVRAERVHCQSFPFLTSLGISAFSCFLLGCIRNRWHS